MIESIKFENYKAFQTGTLELTPITILLGSNSSGKSSILQLFLLFAQSLESTDDFAGAFKLNSKYVSLGEGVNILRNRNPENELFVRFNFKAKSINIDTKIVETLQEYIFHFGRLGIFNEDIPDLLRVLSESKGKENSKVIEDSLIFLRKNITKVEKELSRASDKVHNKKSFYYLTKKHIDELSNLISLCSTLEKNIAVTGIGFNFFYNERTGEIHAKEITAYSDNSVLVSYSNRRSNGYKAHDLSSQLFNSETIEKYRVEFGKNHQIDGLRLINTNQKGRRGYIVPIFTNSVSHLIEDIFEAATSSLEASFRTGLTNHVSPLRAFPQRYYIIDQSYTREAVNTKEGDSLADALKRNTDIRSSVNNWLKKFNLAVDVEALKDIIHSIKINQNGLHLDLTDVGFGISQILPVIVQGFLSKPNSITVIEQPEIHLHPKMQAELADLFIDMTKGVEKRLLVETHSEALLKRLRRRISEGEISAKDVSIYFVHGKNKESKDTYLQKIEIDDKGSFEWPKDFTETEIEDTLAFIKNQ